MSDRKRFLIRKFNPERDLDDAYHCFVSGYHHIAWPLFDHADPRLVKDFITMVAVVGDATFVAEVDGEVGGILVGSFPMSFRNVIREALALSSFLFRVLFGFYRMSPIVRAAMKSMLLWYPAFLLHHPMTRSETLILTSRDEFRGGIGRALMDAWVEETKAGGHRRTTVCTDSELSWDFYERYGFSRVREFRHRAYSISLPGREVTGYIYSLDID